MIILEDTDLHSFKFDKLKVINVNIKGIIKENMEDKQKTDNMKVENDKENIQDKQNPDPMKFGKKKKIKCFHCKTKCTLINFTCDCGHIFCQKHRFPHSHNCSSNKKKDENLKKLEKNNPKLESMKVVTI